MQQQESLVIPHQNLNHRLAEGHATPVPTDKELIQRYLTGEREAYDQLYSRHWQTIVRAAYSILRNEDDAVDAAQEAFVRAFTNLHGFQSRSCFKTWLLNIVSNVAVDIIRKERGRRVSEAEYVANRPIVETREPLDTLVRAYQEWLERRAGTQILLIYELRVVEKLTYAEITQRTGISSWKIRQAVIWLRVKLREYLDLWE